MRVARLSPYGEIAEVVVPDLLPLTAEQEAQCKAEREPGTFYAVIPDHDDEVLSVAFRSPGCIKTLARQSPYG
jgi:hypothetical protein